MALRSIDLVIPADLAGPKLSMILDNFIIKRHDCSVTKA